MSSKGTSGQRPVAVVTGASAGLGRAIVRKFSRRGWNVGLLARGRDRLESTLRDVEADGGGALVLPTDVADYSQVNKAAEAVVSEFGHIDVWINNAMVSVFSPVQQMSPEEFERVTKVTYLGTVHGTLAALKHMTPRDRGAVVQVGSALAYRSIPLQSAYCAAKHAVRGFTEALRCELLHDGSHVRVSIVEGPALNTPQFDWVKSRLPRRPQPVPPIYQPEVGAEAVFWAVMNHPRELDVGISTVAAVWGDKVAPGLLDRYLARNGFASQQTAEPADPNRADNLWQPAPGDPGAHGRFDSQARSSSLQLWFRTHRQWLAGGFALAGLLGWAGMRRCQGSPHPADRSF